MMQSWFLEAKLGIFIHWGIYAVNGVPESWSFFSGQISYEDYFKQGSGFTAEQFDPAAWAALFKRVGARYVVLTTKHHDGVALWDTAQSDLSVVKQTPAGRDLIAEYVTALRAEELRVGFYFSHLDWSHPDYAPIPPNHRTGATMKDIYNSWPDGPQNPHWQRFLAFHRSQLHELCANYGPLDLLWFDGDWQPGPEYWQMGDLRNQLQAWQPNVILNGRLAGHGDYVTPEQGLPIVPPAGPWEFCVTLNDSWGYQPQDHNYKSLRQIVRLFAECIGMGGNLLLDVGPKPDGTIPPEQIALLESLGAWIHQHEEAIYPTTAGLPAGLFYGASTLSQDRKTLYLFTFDRPWEEIAVKGIRNPVKRASILGSGRALKTYKRGGAPWVNVPGVLWLELPEAELDPNATVVKLEFDEPLDLYTGSGISIQAN